MNTLQMAQNQPISPRHKSITDRVNHSLVRLQDDGLVIPKNYNPTNALKSAFFELIGSPSGNLIEKCDESSVANALLNMVIQGLTPAKKQCYFVPYGNRATLQRSYFGTQKVVKDLSEVEDIWATIIYEGDDFELEIVDGRERIKHHVTSFANRDNAIIGAYCVIKKTNGEQVLTVMTKKEIDKSWSKSKNSSVQKDFPQEMAKRTVINRAAKAFINTSNDSDALINSINETTSDEYEDDQERAVRDVTETVEREANQIMIDTSVPVSSAEEAKEIVEAVKAKPKAKAKAKSEPVEEDKQMTLEAVSDEEIDNLLGDLDEPGF